jgi:Ankyrin repeat
MISRLIVDNTLNMRWSENTDAYTAPSSLLELLQLKKFEAILEILGNEQNDFKTLFEDAFQTQRAYTALHIVLQHNPPITVVRMVLARARQICSTVDPTITQDERGMTPLHVAVAHSCHVNTVELFLCGAIVPHNPAAMRDYRGRYPLHWACDNLAGVMSSKAIERVSSDEVEHRMQVINCLITAFPRALDFPDDMGVTPRSMVMDGSGTTDERIRCLLDAGTKLCRHLLLKNIHDDMEGEKDGIFNQVPFDSSGRHVKCGSSRNTEPTAASSQDQKLACFLKSQCSLDDNDVSSIGWDEDEDYVFKPRKSKVQRRLRKLIRSGSVRLDV